MIRDGMNMMDVLTSQQIRAWCDGKIENLRYDPEAQMLTYQITSEPSSRISYRVDDERAKKWRDFESVE